MVQSDTLFRRPDLCLDEDNDNADIVMLPDDMFLNLIDVDLQKKIAMADDLDSSTSEALKLLLETGPTSMTSGLDDWKVENSHGRNILFYKGRTISHETWNYDGRLYKLFMTTKQRDTRGNWVHITQYNNTTGGRAFALL